MLGSPLSAAAPAIEVPSTPHQQPPLAALALLQACGGLKAFVRNFLEVLDLLRTLPTEPKKAGGEGGHLAPAPAAGGDAEMADTSSRGSEAGPSTAAPPAAAAAVAAAGDAAGPSGSDAAAAGAEGQAQQAQQQPLDLGAQYRRSLGHLANTSLVFMTNLSYVTMVTNSPNSAAFITAPVPGTGTLAISLGVDCGLAGSMA